MPRNCRWPRFRPGWLTVVANTIVCLLLLSTSGAPAASLEIFFPASQIDVHDQVHLNWYASAPDDPTHPVALPDPVFWLESSPEQTIAAAQNVVVPGDSAALYAIDLFIHETIDSIAHVELWSDYNSQPHVRLSRALPDPDSTGAPARRRYRLIQPIHIRKSVSLWVVAILPQSGDTRVGLVPPSGIPMLTALYPLGSHLSSWTPWPDYNIGCALVTTRSNDSHTTSTADSIALELLRVYSSNSDTTRLATLSRYQTHFSDIPDKPGYDVTYIWNLASGPTLSTLEVPYSLATALAWGRCDIPAAISTGTQLSIPIINRSPQPLQITVTSTLNWQPGTPDTLPLPEATTDPVQLEITAQTTADIAVNFQVPIAASGVALMTLTATDSGTAPARPAVCSLVLHFGVTGIARDPHRHENLYAPYPNPTNSAATIPVPPGVHSIDIFNTLGNRIAHRRIPAPRSAITWPLPGDAKAIPSGVYFIRLNRQGTPLFRTLTVIK